MKKPQIFIENGPFVVMAEDIWDYYKDPPIRIKLFETNDYLEALNFVYDYYNQCNDSDLEYPWIKSLWITPEPPGLHFDYNSYIEYLKTKSLLTPKPMYKIVKIDLLDSCIHADVFDDQAYTLIKESEDLEDLLGFAIEGFKLVNPSISNYKDWEEKAEDGGYEVEIFNDDYKSLFRGSMMLLSPHVEIALRMALRHHAGQIRKGDGMQYIIHILNISRLLYGRGGMEIDPVLIAASLCHDLLEDTDCQESEIEKWCGSEVLKIVKAVSNDDSLAWEDKKMRYVETVRAGGEKAMIVCLADKIVNLESLLKIHEKEGEEIWNKFNRGKEKKLWFEKSVLKMLKENLEHPLIERYERLIKELEVLIDLKNEPN